MKTRLLLAGALLSALTILGDDIRSPETELVTIHRADRRDPALCAETDEFVFVDGTRIVFAGGDRLVRRAAEDFADYLRVSMSVTAEIQEGTGTAALVLSLDPQLAPRSAVIETSKTGVAVRAADGRAVMQALFHLEDLMNLREAPFLKFGTERRREKYIARMVHSGCGNGAVPDGHLGALAHAGFDSILFYVQNDEKGFERKLIADAEAWGLGAYLYSSLKAEVHPDDPKATEVFDHTYGEAGRRYPTARGIIIVPESCGFPSRDPRVKEHPRRYPYDDYPLWSAAAEKAYKAGNPNGDFIFWTYNFCWFSDRERCAFIRNATPTTAINLSFVVGGEDRFHRTGAGSFYTVEDYSICEPGPAPIFIPEADEAHRRGLRLYTMVNTGGRTWDFGTVPYMPVPQMWNLRYEAIERARQEWNVCGLMESHHYGFTPNFIAELSKEAFTEGGMPFDRHIRAIAARDFGAAHAEEVVAIWNDLSEAIRDDIATGENQYSVFRAGVAYPFNAGRPPVDANEIPGWKGRKTFCNPNYMRKTDPETGKTVLTDISLHFHRHKDEVRLFRPLGTRFVSGAAKLRSFAQEQAGRRRADGLREAGVVEYIGRSFLTAANVKDGALAERRGDEAAILRLAREEYANALAALPLMESDPRLGWEPTMGYFAGPEALKWKLQRMRKSYEVAGK